jgi:pilus assembly protein CpaB
MTTYAGPRPRRPAETNGRRRSWLRSLGRAFSWHRRKLAVVAAAAAVLCGISAAAPSAPTTVAVVRAARQLAGGAVITASDLSVAQVRPGDLPVGAYTDVGAVVGQTLAAPVAKGQVLTPLAISSGRTGVGTGHVMAPLRLGDAGMAALLHPGDVVDVVAADTESAKATVVADGVRVITVPQEPDDPATDRSSAGALVLLDVDRPTAANLARAAVSATLTVVWR